ncbi:MAG: hypothetical protein IT368_04260 [Candidatus Hydrogenedentes bacterium]|nr:hypothetical protein [Candidatus Hydrogenedentota bacterium]
MKLHQHDNFWPWACALITTAAMTLGLMADGIADTVAAILLCVPVAVVFRKMRPSRD